MTDGEFTKQFHTQPTFLKKIQLAIREDRYTIWTRNPPNFPEEYLKPVLDLPDQTPVTRKAPRWTWVGFRAGAEIRISRNGSAYADLSQRVLCTG